MSELPAAQMRTMTIDRAARDRAVRELMRQYVVSRRRRLWAIAVVTLALMILLPSWLLGLALGVVLALIQLSWWRIRVGASLRKGYAVGLTISVGYLDSEELTVVDQTGQVSFPRGSVLKVVRRGGIASILGRSISLMLPDELLSDADVAFLEGHGEPPEEVVAPAPTMPLALEVTQEVQDAIVAAKTSVILTSADFLIAPLAIPLFVWFASYMGSWRFMAGAFVFGVVCWTPQLSWLVKSRRVMREVYPIGFTVQADVNPERLALAYPHGTVQEPWQAFAAHRVTSRAVLLRRQKGRPAKTLILPRALFGADDLARIAVFVRQRF